MRKITGNWWQLSDGRVQEKRNSCKAVESRNADPQLQISLWEGEVSQHSLAKCSWTDGRDKGTVAEVCVSHWCIPI